MEAFRGERRLTEHDIRHECALLGIVTAEPTSSMYDVLSNGLTSLQHRGEEAAGLAWVNREHVAHVKNLGLTESALAKERIMFPDAVDAAIGHTRYSTSGAGEKDREKKNSDNVQPFVFGGKLAVAHNGTVYSDYPTKPNEPTSDTYKVGKAIHEAGGIFEEDAIKVLSSLEGAYTFLFLTPGGLYVARDPAGFRPAVIGRFTNGTSGYAVASETVGLHAVNAESVAEVSRGSLSLLTPSGPQLLWVDPRTESVEPADCSFEKSYFADAASRMDHVTNHSKRATLGQRLVERQRPTGDFVVPIPNSGWSYAEGIANTAALPIRQAIQVNRYRGRSFIQAETPEERMQTAFKKYRFIPELIEGQDFVVVDDSIVRGNTTQGLILALFEMGASRVELLSGIPPITDPCYWGIDFKDPNELIYNRLMNDSSERGTFEERLARWLVGGREDLARRLRVQFQTLPDYASIIQNVPLDTPLEDSGGCFHCVSGVVPKGTEVPVTLFTRKGE